MAKPPIQQYPYRLPPSVKRRPPDRRFYRRDAYTTFFRELYEVEFPDRDEILIDGYRALISEKLLESAFVEPDTIEPEGTPILGCDFAGGGNDRSAYVIRYDNIIKLLQTNKIGSLS